MSRVPQSNAFRSMDFLNRLGAARRPDRMEMLNGLTTIQLRGFGEVANCIRRRKILIQRRDKHYFRQNEYLLRILSSSDQPKRGRSRISLDNMTSTHDYIPAISPKVQIPKLMNSIRNDHVIRVFMCKLA